jgi:hypothetical protein
MDIKKSVVMDDRIVQKLPQYAIEKGALSQTNQTFRAQAETPSQQTYQITVPSTNVFVDRAVQWTSTVALNLQVNLAVAPVVAGLPILVYGRDFALAPFPLHTLTTSMSANINDANVSVNTSDILQEILRLSSYAKNRQQRTCPTYLDSYVSYDNSALALNSPLVDYSATTGCGEIKNGAYYRWDISGQNASIIGTTLYNITFTFTSTEKLILPPFVFSDDYEYSTGLYGIQNINFTFNMATPQVSGGANRPLRFTTSQNALLSAGAGASISYQSSAVSYNNSNMNVIFLTPPVSMDLPPRSVVPWMEFPRYITNVSGVGIAPGFKDVGRNTQTITLPVVPDMLVVYCRPTTYGATQGDFHLPISKVSVNFDNFSGLLSTYSEEELYAMSYKNGLELDWNAFVGQGNLVGQGVVGDATGAGLVGGFLVMRPGRDIPLSEGLAPGVVGNYTLQLNMDVYNNTGSAVSAYSIYVLTINSGFFESISGSSRLLRGVINQQEVIDGVMAEDAPTRGQLDRIVGGGFFDKLSSALGKADIGKMIEVAKQVAPVVKTLAPKTEKYLSAVGLGKQKLAQRLMG